MIKKLTTHISEEELKKQEALLNEWLQEDNTKLKDTTKIKLQQDDNKKKEQIKALWQELIPVIKIINPFLIKIEEDHKNIDHLSWEKVVKINNEIKSRIIDNDRLFSLTLPLFSDIYKLKMNIEAIKNVYLPRMQRKALYDKERELRNLFSNHKLIKQLDIFMENIESVIQLMATMFIDINGNIKNIEALLEEPKIQKESTEEKKVETKNQESNYNKNEQGPLESMFFKKRTWWYFSDAQAWKWTKRFIIFYLIYKWYYQGKTEAHIPKLLDYILSFFV